MRETETKSQFVDASDDTATEDNASRPSQLIVVCFPDRCFKRATALMRDFPKIVRPLVLLT